MSSRLCETCNLLFTGPLLLRQEAPHHQSYESITSAASRGCYVCRIITRSDAWASLHADSHFKLSSYLEPLLGNLAGWFNLTLDAVESEVVSSGGSEEGDHDPVVVVPGRIADAKEQADRVLPELEPQPSAPIWSFSIQPAKDVERNIGDHVPPNEFRLSSLLQLGQQWLHKCRTEHFTCNNQNPNFRPTRLLEIVDKHRGRIMSSEELIASQQYATLSHCWGKSRILTLTTSNIDQLKSGIKLSELPTSYQEAILVCNKFGYRYIWIDSLCIIQDSIEDWHTEAMAMRHVYRNSMLNIAAAAAAENTNSSFTARDASTISPLPISIQWEDHEPRKYYLSNANAYRDEVAFSPLRRRAWVVQEVWLASHNLYLTKNQLWWKCCEVEASEAYPEGLPEVMSAQGSLTGFGKQRYDRAGLHHSWNRLVETYSACSLTIPSDKLIAFAGIAQHFEHLLGNNDDNYAADIYAAGLWCSQLPRALCWFSTKESQAHRPSAYRAPSWSWASLEGSIRFGQNPPESERGSIKLLCSVLEVKTQPVNQDSTGSLTGGSITLHGSLTRIGYWNDRMTVEDSDGKLSLIPGADTMAYSLDEEHWTLVDDDETTHPGWSYMDGLTLQDLKSGRMDRTVRRTAHWIDGEYYPIFSLPVMSWIGMGKPWMKGLILFRVEVEGVHTYQRIGRFTARGSIPIFRLTESPAESVLIV
ncbi:hypothetical protein VTL71DRAFT_9052 [Oculimacula yallundae]|uniref:Heterokaryon incompatibility domain-containing protein n=1 Tax=Oculimacula yallundae TaxID=86028 RepID=A0ABR4BTN2_9HELO